jgi:phage pi2 protein 07
MKPDGTHTKEEILELIQNELQSWERGDICAKLLKDCSDNTLSDLLSRYTPEYISAITGYYVYEEEREDVSNISLRDFMHGSNYDEADLWDYIETNTPDYRVANWISSSKIDKTVLLDNLDRDILIKYFNSRFYIEITPRKED